MTLIPRSLFGRLALLLLGLGVRGAAGAPPAAPRGLDPNGASLSNGMI